MTTLIDSNVLLDVVNVDEKWFTWSSAALAAAAEEGPLVINPIIYSEVSVQFSTVQALDAALPPDVFLRAPLMYEAGFLAGKAQRAYRRRGGRRTGPIADFYIGAHAAVTGCRLLTRDPRRFRQYFPTVPVIAPG